MTALLDSPPGTADRFSSPLYTVAEAARYLDVPGSTLVTWAKGYCRRSAGRPDVDSYLRRLDFADDGYAQRIRLPAYEVADVRVDPNRGFGQPIFARGGARL